MVTFYSKNLSVTVSSSDKQPGNEKSVTGFVLFVCNAKFSRVMSSLSDLDSFHLIIYLGKYAIVWRQIILIDRKLP